MIQFIQQLINGLSLGSIYALIALGYTMVYGIIKLINFAHGDIYMLGAYIGFFATTYLGLSFFPALIMSMVVCAFIGVVIERVAYKPLRKASRIAALITAIGVSYLIEALVQRFMGTGVKTYPNVVAETTMHLGEVIISTKQIWIFIITISLMVILQYVVKHTRIGRSMRAVSVDSEAAQLMGVNVDTTISITFAIGSALAGAAGVLVGVYYNSINPLMGMVPGVKAFIAAVFGGIGIIPGAMLGGFFIGIVETLVVGYGSSLYKDLVVYLILIIVLIFKPSGLLGRNKKEKV